MLRVMSLNRGTFRFEDVFSSGDDRLVRQVQQTQRQIQFDDPANIQFTSVNEKEVTHLTTTTSTTTDKLKNAESFPDRGRRAIRKERR